MKRLGPLLEVLTVGLPFCAFKILTGLLLIARFAPLGWFLILLGALDLFVNAINLAPLAAGRPRVLGVCLTQIALHRLFGAEWDELGISIDVMLSFILVAAVIGFGMMARLGESERQLWNLAVILNVLGAGFGRVSSSLSARAKGA